MLLALLLCAAQTSTDAPLALSGTWKAGTKSAPVFLRSKWRRAVGEALSKRPPPNTLTDVFEFGVYTGTSLQRIFEELQEHNISARRVWGFDSFVGLASDSGSEDGGRSSWFKGAFSAAEALRAHNYNEVKQRITAHILESKTLGSSEASRRVRKSLRFVRGFFNESLTPKLPQNRGIGPAMYVDVDVDQYFAAKQVRDIPASHRPAAGVPVPLLTGRLCFCVCLCVCRVCGARRRCRGSSSTALRAKAPSSATTTSARRRCGARERAARIWKLPTSTRSPSSSSPSMCASASGSQRRRRPPKLQRRAPACPRTPAGATSTPSSVCSASASRATPPPAESWGAWVGESDLSMNELAHYLMRRRRSLGPWWWGGGSPFPAMVLYIGPGARLSRDHLPCDSSIEATTPF